MNNAEPQREPRTLCVLCVEGPREGVGHPGVAAQIHQVGNSDRVYQRVVCEFCGAEWVRRREKAGVFEWLRVLD